MDRQKADAWCETGILWLVCGIVCTGPVAMGAVHTLDFAVLLGMGMLATILWIARLWLAERPKILWPPVCWAALAFVLLAIGRYLSCDIEYAGRQELIRILLYACILLVVVNNTHRQEHLQIIAVALVIVATAISMFALYQFYTKSHWVWGYISPYAGRASGTYISPNHLGGFLEMVLPLGLAFALTGRLRAVPRILLGYACLVVIAAIAVTLSRGTWLGLLAGLIVFLALLIITRQFRIPALAILGLIIVAAIFVFPKLMFIQLRITRMLVNNEINENTRFEVWEPAWRMFLDHKMWGVGPGHFDSVFRAFRPQSVQLQPDWVHNDYLNTLTDWGLSGFLIVLAAFLLVGFAFPRIWRYVRPKISDLGPWSGSSRFAFALGSAVALVSILVHSFVDFNMHIPANAIVCVTLLGLLASLARFTTDSHWFSAGTAAKLALTLGLACTVAYLGWQGVRSVNERLCLARAEAKPQFSIEQAELLKRAFAVEPKNPDTAYQIGEAYRLQSQLGGEEYTPQAKEALQWYETSSALDPWSGYALLRAAMVKDWLGEPQAAESLYNRAVQLDPNGYYMIAHVGLHYMQQRDYAAAIPWFVRSLKLQDSENDIARNYLRICQERLLEEAELIRKLTPGGRR